MKHKKIHLMLFGVVLLVAATPPAMAAPTLTVNGSTTPITVSPGATVTIVAAGIAPDSNNVLALYPAGTRTATEQWVYLSSLAGATWIVPLSKVGVWEVQALRYVTGSGYAVDATSPTITVSSGTPPVVVPPVIVPPVIPPPPVVVPPVVATATLASQSVTVTITGGPGGVLDWLGLFLVGAPDTQYLDWFRLNGTKVAPRTGTTTGKATFAIPLTGGPWEIRLLTSDGAGTYTRVAVIITYEMIKRVP